MAALGVIALCVCWVGLVRHAASGRFGPARVVAAAVAWALPFVLGPPLFSRDAYAYAAQGELARRGLDPATHGVAALGGDPAGAAFAVAVDPRWRETHAPYGGAAVAVERLAATIGRLLDAGPIAAVVTMRVVAVVSVVAMTALTVRLLDRPATQSADRPTDRPTDRPATVGAAAGPARQPTGQLRGDRRPAVVLALVAANPVTIIQLVGGAHLDALAGAALVAALVVDRARVRRAGAGGQVTAAARGTVASAGRSAARATTAITAAATALGCLAGTVKATAFLVLAWLVVAHARDAWRAGGAGARPSRRTAMTPAAAVVAAAALDTVVIAVVLAGSVLASGFGLTWIGALRTSGALATGVAPASIIAALVAAAARLCGADVAAGTGPLLDACRTACLGASAVVVAVLLARAWRRPGPDPALAVTARTPSARVATGTGTVIAAATATATTATGTATGTGTDRRDDLVVPGVGGLAIALGSPVLYPWYLALGLPALAVLIAGWDGPGTARRRRAVLVTVVACSVWLCVSTLSPLGATWRLVGPAGPGWPVPVLVVATALGALVAIAGRAIRRRPAP